MLRRTAIIGTLIIILGCLAAAKDETVWQIGKFNESSREFKSENIDYADAKSDVVFHVGSSKDEDWPRFQSGPANGMTGGREHPYTIVFDLPQQPSGVYNLKIAMLYETPRLSYLKIGVNGHSGLFYFHPKLNYAAGDWEGTFVPQTSMDTKTIAIPAKFLKQGENRIVLTALDDPSTVENSLGAIAPGHTGIVYDALQFTHDPGAKYDEKGISAQIIPTIFYKEERGALREIVEVYASFANLPKQGEATLTISGKHYQTRFDSQEEFGERKLEFLVNEWTGTAKAKVAFPAPSISKTVQAEISPAKKWTVYVIPHEHLDIGFTDYPARVAELHAESVDGAMKLIDRYPDFRWTVDGFWVAQQYMAARPKDRKEKFLEYLRAGTIALPLEFANQHTGNASWEGMARSFYDSHEFVKAKNLPVNDGAQIVDVPSYPWPYASVLADAGVKYFIAASNSWRAPVMLQGRWNEKSPFYWEGPDGKRVMMWYSRAYLQLHTLFGGPWRMASIRDALPVYLQAYTRPDYTANSALIFGSQLENTALGKEQAQLVGEYSKVYAYPRLQFATVSTAMSAIERGFGGKLPVYKGDFGPYWEDGYGSDAIGTAGHRDNQTRILTAEKMGTIPALIKGDVLPDRALLKEAWNNQLLYDEHTWTYVGATSQPQHQQADDQIALKRARTTEGAREIAESVQRSWQQFSAMILPRDNSLAVFNPLNWERSGLVSYDLQDGTEIVDATTGKPVPFEVEWRGKGYKLPGFGGGYRRVHFMAENIPSVGYKLYSLKPAPAPQAKSQPVSGNVIENEYYRIELDPATASVKSIFDKKLNRELSDPNSPYKFGQYLYVSGAEDYPNDSLYRYGASLMPPKLDINPATNGKLISAVHVPYGTIVTMEATAKNTPYLRTEIVLFDNEKKIEFRYKLRKDRVLDRESVYFAFPFKVENPTFTYSTQAGWVDPAKDELPGGSREWYLPTQWAAVSGDGVTAAVSAIDAPLMAFGDIVRGKWPTEFKPASSAMFSWVMNNYWGTNFQAWQGGEFSFRYAITSAPTLDPVALTRFGWEARTPVESGPIAASFDPSPLPTDKGSFLQTDNPSVVVTTWKLAEDNDGTILRVHETSGRETHVRITSPFLRLNQAWTCSVLEENRAELPAGDGGVEVTLKPFEVQTIRVRTTAKSPAKESE